MNDDAGAGATSSPVAAALGVLRSTAERGWGRWAPNRQSMGRESYFIDGDMSAILQYDHKNIICVQNNDRVRTNASYFTITYLLIRPN